MNAHALLTSQGWRGTGNSLHPTTNEIGLSKPLLVARKDDNHGIGKKHKTSDMWWMNAFDKTLQGLDTTTEGTVVQTITNGGLDMVKKGGGKWVLEKGGLYANFVKGEGLAGSLSRLKTSADPQPKKRKRKSVETETKEDRRARKALKRALKVSKKQHDLFNGDNPKTSEAVEHKKKSKKRKKDKSHSEALQKLADTQNLTSICPDRTVTTEVPVQTMQSGKENDTSDRHSHASIDNESGEIPGKLKKKKKKKPKE